MEPTAPSASKETPLRPGRRGLMKFSIGMLIGIIWLALANVTYGKAAAGSAAGHPDLRFWWGVITALLTIAALGVLIGTHLHTRPQSD